MTEALYDRVRRGLELANARAAAPVTFLDVNATETRDIASGTVTLTDGEEIEVLAFPTYGADRWSIEQGLAQQGQRVLAVRASILIRSGGISFVPEVGQRVRIAGSVETIERIKPEFDEAGEPLVFFCALRS